MQVNSSQSIAIHIQQSMLALALEEYLHSLIENVWNSSMRYQTYLEADSNITVC